MKIILLVISCLLYLTNFASPIVASFKSQFITIVNPVRISSYTPNPTNSLKAQYQELKKRELPATWLLTYDALIYDGIPETLTSMDKNQEIGIFMEITLKLAEAAGISYNKTDSWHRANSLFLSGYTQQDRIKLIDTVFEKFKTTLGYYPTSVGAWWIDSYSLEYMKNKYNITASLGVADQFSTDGYHVWGQYWSVPFYPSKLHAGMPAGTSETKLDLVMFQWAARDPIGGYGGSMASLYSTQDYFTINLSDDYFKKLIDLYARKNRNEFGQITIGLESDLSPDAYRGVFARQMEIVKQLRESKEFRVTTMGQFSSWYRGTFTNLSPEHVIETDDLLEGTNRAIWYQSPSLRVGLVYDSKLKKLKMIDFRNYYSDFQEPYYVSPNKEIDLYINTPSIIDTINDHQTFWDITDSSTFSMNGDNKKLLLKLDNNREVKLTKDRIQLFNITPSLPKVIANNPGLSIKKDQQSITIFPKAEFVFPPNGLMFKDLSIQATYFLWRPKVQIAVLVIYVLLGLSAILILKWNFKARLKIIYLGFYVTIVVSSLIILKTQYSQTYFVNQSEIDALLHLASLPFGRVVVYKNGCLICSFHTENPHPAFANKKEYVRNITKKPIVYNQEIFLTKSRDEGKRELQRLKAKYIYLVKFEDYNESLPFSPGDYNIEKIFENSNAQIWRVKDW